MGFNSNLVPKGISLIEEAISESINSSASTLVPLITRIPSGSLEQDSEKYLFPYFP